MKTLIAIMQYVGVAFSIFGFCYAFGLMVADEIYKTALGLSAYYGLDAISPWTVAWMPVTGGAILVVSYIMDAVFKAGEKSATKEEED